MSSDSTDLCLAGAAIPGPAAEEPSVPKEPSAPPVPETETPRATGAGFATTRWTMVLNAGGPTSEEAHLALEELCRAYWRPICSYVRRCGHGPHDAQDLTQEFLSRLLASGSLNDVSPAKGRFRSFLLASLKHFLANEWDRVRSQKRGGRATIIPLDLTDADAACGAVECDRMNPERVFERQWALALLDRVLHRLRDEQHDMGKGPQFEKLKECLVCDRHSMPYARLAAELSMSQGAVKVAVHRLRQRYREFLRQEIAGTVSDPAQVEEELGHLYRALCDSS